jgi:glutathione S-transferase
MMTMKLYYNPQSRATIAKWLLDEAHVQYETVDIDLKKQEHKAPAFLAINPAGKLPALVDGVAMVFESPAIALYITERFPESKLAPPVGSPERGRFLSLMFYSTAQLEPAMGDVLLKVPASPSRGWTNFETAQDVVEAELKGGPWLFGNSFTAADVMIGSMFIWNQRFGGTNRPKLQAYVDRLLARDQAVVMRA